MSLKKHAISSLRLTAILFGLLVALMAAHDIRTLVTGQPDKLFFFLFIIFFFIVPAVAAYTIVIGVIAIIKGQRDKIKALEKKYQRKD